MFGKSLTAREKQLAHGSHVITPANMDKTAPEGLFAPHFYEFARHRHAHPIVAVFMRVDEVDDKVLSGDFCQCRRSRLRGQHCGGFFLYHRAFEEIRVLRTPQPHRIGEYKIAEIIFGDVGLV